MVPFKSEVSAMADLVDHLKSLGGHPPVEELCHCVTERYDWLVSTVDAKYTATQECCRMAREFEQGEGVMITSQMEDTVNECTQLYSCMVVVASCVSMCTILHLHVVVGTFCPMYVHVSWTLD